MKVNLSPRLKKKLKNRTRPYLRSRLFRDMFISDEHYRKTGVEHSEALAVENRPRETKEPEIVASERSFPGIRTEDFEPEIMTAAQVYTLYEDLDDTGRTYPEYERGYER